VLKIKHLASNVYIIFLTRTSFNVNDLKEVIYYTH